MTCSSRSWFWNKTLFLNNCSQYYFSYLKNMAGNLFSFCKSSTNDMNRSAMLSFSFVIESFTVKWSITAATCEKNELIIQVFAIEGAVMQVRLEVIGQVCLQWNPSCEATLFAPEKWPFKRGGLSSGVEINAIMFRFTLSRGLSRGGDLSSGWPLKRGSTVHINATVCHFMLEDLISNNALWAECDKSNLIFAT